MPQLPALFRVLKRLLVTSVPLLLLLCLLLFLERQLVCSLWHFVNWLKDGLIIR